ncbi:MAG: glycosyltransferase [Candidatus Diapherotrites archaeon]
MLLSIVIGALNEEKYIAKTLETANCQKTSHKVEVIVGDGYSEDKTIQIAKKLGAKVVQEKNRSAAWERQAGSKIAKGEVICFTDADADIPDSWIQTIAEEFEKDKKLALLYGPVYLSDDDSFNKKLSKYMMYYYLSILSKIGMHNPIGSNIAVRRTAFEKIGGFNTALVTAEDLDLAKRIRKEGKLKFNPKVFLDVSARRVKKWGYVRYAIFHMINGLKFQFFGKSSKEYHPVR